MKIVMVTNVRQGFTIVELLIVIVVIAILASISLVAYNGIQQRAMETRVQADLTNATKQLQLYAVQKGALPSAPGNVTDARFYFSPVGSNVILCAASTSEMDFAIVMRDVQGSKKWYKYESSVGKVEVVQPADASASGLCATTSYPARLWGTHWVQGG